MSYVTTTPAPISTLEFYAPDSLDGSTKYAIKVSTNYIKKGSQRKEPLSCWSHPQTVVKD
ncbi:MAG: hypothetical protein SOZ84_00610 [Treponema sp.]|nr:hypothetical protein [Treponema sp.]